MYVAQGVTRRQTMVGGALASAVLGVTWSAVYTAIFGIEYAYYSLADLTGDLTEPYPVASVADGARTFVITMAMMSAYVCGGWIVGAMYYRFGALWGSLAIPVGLMPLAAAEFLLSTYSADTTLWEEAGLGDLSQWIAVPIVLVLVLVAVGAAVVNTVSRAVPIRLPSM